MKKLFIFFFNLTFIHLAFGMQEVTHDLAIIKERFEQSCQKNEYEQATQEYMRYLAAASINSQSLWQKDADGPYYHHWKEGAGQVMELTKKFAAESCKKYPEFKKYFLALDANKRKEILSLHMDSEFVRIYSVGRQDRRQEFQK